MTATTDAELDAACLRMQPAARKLVDAVKSRDPALTRAAFADVYRVDVPLGRTPLAVLAVVLAEELIVAEAVPGGDRIATAATRAERDRCVRLATAVARTTGAGIVEQARRLPTRIARGDVAS
jgi:hypothetical protein